MIRQNWRAALVLAALALVQSACRSDSPNGSSAPPEVSVAAAANLSGVLGTIGARFEKATRVHPVFSFGSTAELATQIAHSAPYDVFLAADAKHVEDLARGGFLEGGGKVYARGVLAVWAPAASRAQVRRVEDVAVPEVRVIAVAQPDLAPYGEASVETLRRLGLWDRVKSKIVYAPNISAAKQFGASGNADVVFTAYSLVLRETGSTVPVDEMLHKAIDQELGILAHCRHQEAARRFADFVLSEQGQDILTSNGYLAVRQP